MAFQFFKVGDEVRFVSEDDAGQCGTRIGMIGFVFDLVSSEYDEPMLVVEVDGGTFQTYARRWEKVVSEEATKPEEVTQTSLEGAELANLIVQARDLKISIETAEQSYKLLLESIETLAAKYGLAFITSPIAASTKTLADLHAEGPGAVKVGMKVKREDITYVVSRLDYSDEERPIRLISQGQYETNWPEASTFYKFTVIG